MPKRRRSHVKAKAEVKEEQPAPATPASEHEEEDEEEEDAEAAAAVQQLLALPPSPAPAAPALPQTPTTAGLQVARTRLTGLLHRVSKPAGTVAEDSDSSQDDVPLSQSLTRASSPPEASCKRARSPVPAAVKIKTEAGTTPSTTPSSGKQGGKRRKRREAVTDSAFHHTYVMKLFDRSVDLAQFRETTSLYPVCRAWMANQPRNPNLLPKRGSASPAGSDDEEDDDKSDESTKDSNEEEPIKPVHKLPPPDALETRLRVPPIKPHVLKSFVVNQEADGKDERALLSEHVTRWRDVKSKWMQAAHANEQRFHESITIIEEIYKKAQEMYA